MDWQLVEISVVTVLALWVILFANNGLSRAAAAVMIVLNVLWILFEREKPETAKANPPRRQEETPEAERPSGHAGEQAADRSRERSHRIL